MRQTAAMAWWVAECIPILPHAQKKGLAPGARRRFLQRKLQVRFTSLQAQRALGGQRATRSERTLGQWPSHRNQFLREPLQEGCDHRHGVAVVC